MRTKPLIDFTRGLKTFVWKKAEDVVLRIAKPSPLKGSCLTTKPKKVKPVRKRKSYEVDI